MSEYNPKLTNKDTYTKTKELLDQMIEEKKQQQKLSNPVKESPEITQIFKDLSDRRGLLKN